MNKYWVAFTRYKHYFSLELEIETYGVEANDMKEAIEKTKAVNSVYGIISVSKLDESINWEDLD
jgi:hypothetical protein